MTKTHVIILGAQGMLGSYVYSYLRTLTGIYVHTVGRNQLDCTADTDEKQISQFARAFGVGDASTWVINAAGVTGKGEMDQENIMRVNGTYSKMWHRVSTELEWKYVYVSTNGVFARDQERVYDESFTPNADTVYGRSKVVGEHGMVIRTSIIGEDERNFRGFIEFAKKNHHLEVDGFINEKWNGVTCLALAQYFGHLIVNDQYRPGITHICSEYVTTKCELLRLINEIWQLGLNIRETECKEPRSALLASLCRIEGQEFVWPPIEQQLRSLHEWGVQNKRQVFKRIMIVGGTGSLGTELIQRWYYRTEKFIIYSRSEHKQWELARRFPKVSFSMVLGDVADDRVMERALLTHAPTMILYAAAMKHVNRCEFEPERCLATNFSGFASLVNTVRRLRAFGSLTGLGKILYVSTDKACAPINVYGMSKSMSEHLVTHAGVDGVKVTAVRYGNVINSNGSIIPILQRQATDRRVKELTLTDARMTRFYMTLQQSVQLIEDCIIYGQNGEIWIPHLQSMKILDLFNIFSRHCDKPVTVVGIRPGEKIHESLLAEHELLCTSIKYIDNRRCYVIGQELQSKLECNSIRYTSAHNIIPLSHLRKMLIYFL